MYYQKLFIVIVQNTTRFIVTAPATALKTDILKHRLKGLTVTTNKKNEAETNERRLY